MGTVWVRAAAAITLAAAAGCETCPYQVVADVTVQLDGGEVSADAGGEAYCASACSPSDPCGAGEHCSRIVTGGDGPWGLCFKDR